MTTNFKSSGNYVQDSFKDYMAEAIRHGYDRTGLSEPSLNDSYSNEQTRQKHAASFTNRVYTEMLHFEGMNRAQIGKQIREFHETVKDNDKNAALFGSEMIKTFADPVRKDLHPEYRMPKN